MTLLIVAQPDQPDQKAQSNLLIPNPIELLRHTLRPQYCGICACPCLKPRLPTSQPDLPDIPLDEAAHRMETPAWLHQFHHLQPSRGILPYPYDPETATSSFQSYSSPNKHVIPIHLYCLRAVIGITKAGMWNCSSAADDQMMVGWSVPRWTGFGPWVNESTVSPAVGMGWSGMADQKGRFVQGVEGSHLRAVDLVSPLDLDNPMSYALSLTSTPIKRKCPTSLLPFMPPHILTSIATTLLDPSSTGLAAQNPSEVLDDLLSFCRSCATFRQIHLPETTWAELATLAVDRFRTEQCDRWRANPTGSGGIAPVWISLDTMFVTPVTEALKRAESERTRLRATIGSAFDRDSDEGSGEFVRDEPGLSARDVLHWWIYSDVWRSRRRVWHTVIYACAEARNADWI